MTIWIMARTWGIECDNDGLTNKLKLTVRTGGALAQLLVLSFVCSTNNLYG